MQKADKKENKEVDDSIHQRIREAIQSRGMKLKQFSRESGLAYPSLRDYFGGLRRPGFEALCKILNFTHVSADWLLLGKGPMFHDEKPPVADIDEELVTSIYCEVEKIIHDESMEAAEAPEDDFAYSLAQKEFRKKQQITRQRAAITANVYNRVSRIEDEEERTRYVSKEIQSLLRFQRTLMPLDPE